MTGNQFFLLAAALSALAGVFGNSKGLDNLPLAMVTIASEAAECVEGKKAFGHLVMDCTTPIQFADIRKLDMRSEHRARSVEAGARIVQIGR